MTRLEWSDVFFNAYDTVTREDDSDAVLRATVAEFLSCYPSCTMTADELFDDFRRRQ